MSEKYTAICHADDEDLLRPWAELLDWELSVSPLAKLHELWLITPWDPIIEINMVPYQGEHENREDIHLTRYSTSAILDGNGKEITRI